MRVVLSVDMEGVSQLRLPTRSHRLPTGVLADR